MGILNASVVGFLAAALYPALKGGRLETFADKACWLLSFAITIVLLFLGITAVHEYMHLWGYRFTGIPREAIQKHIFSLKQPFKTPYVAVSKAVNKRQKLTSAFFPLIPGAIFFVLAIRMYTLQIPENACVQGIFAAIATTFAIAWIGSWDDLYCFAYVLRLPPDVILFDEGTQLKVVFPPEKPYQQGNSSH